MATIGAGKRTRTETTVEKQVHVARWRKNRSSLQFSSSAVWLMVVTVESGDKEATTLQQCLPINLQDLFPICVTTSIQDSCTFIFYWASCFPHLGKCSISTPGIDKWDPNELSVRLMEVGGALPLLGLFFSSCHILTVP